MGRRAGSPTDSRGRPPKTDGSKRGRPSKWTEENRKRIVLMIRAGNDKYVAAQAMGVSRTVLKDWLLRAKKDKNAGKLSPFVVFAAEVRAAIADSEQIMVSGVLRGVQKDWKAAAWWLERRAPVRWRPKPPPPPLVTQNNETRPTIIIQEAAPPVPKE